MIASFLPIPEVVLGLELDNGAGARLANICLDLIGLFDAGVRSQHLVSWYISWILWLN